MSKNDMLSHILTPELYTTVFDAYRLVDVSENIICEVLNNKITTSHIPCFQIWDRSKPCDNCISFRAFHEKEQVVKLEYNNGVTFLIIAVPLEIDNESLVLELIKDVSHSLVTTDKTLLEENRLSSLIDKLNNFITSDSSTGLHNKNFLLKHLSEVMKQSQENHTPFAMITINLKNLSETNLAFGKDTGALIVFRIAQILQSHINNMKNIGKHCWTARYDESTFLLIYQQEVSASVKTYAGDLKKEIEQIQIYTRNTPPKISTALSITEYDYKDQDVISFIQKGINKAI